MLILMYLGAENNSKYLKTHSLCYCHFHIAISSKVKDKYSCFYPKPRMKYQTNRTDYDVILGILWLCNNMNPKLGFEPRIS